MESLALLVLPMRPAEGEGVEENWIHGNWEVASIRDNVSLAQATDGSLTPMLGRVSNHPNYLRRRRHVVLHQDTEQ